NDITTDKATYSQTITVPTGLTVLANGEPGPTTTRDGQTTFRWFMNRPMASELAMIAIGDFNVTRGVVDGLPNITAIDLPIEARSSTTPLDDLRRGVVEDLALTGFGVDRHQTRS